MTTTTATPTSAAMTTAEGNANGDSNTDSADNNDGDNGMRPLDEVVKFKPKDQIFGKISSPAHESRPRRDSHGLVP